MKEELWLKGRVLAWFEISDATLYRWIEDGFPEPVILGGRAYFEVSAMQRWYDGEKAKGWTRKRIRRPEPKKTPHLEVV